jgi:outer membrane protein assembly factor BamB
MSKFWVGCLVGASSARSVRARLPRFRPTRALWLALGAAALALASPGFAQTNWAQTNFGPGHASYNAQETTISPSNVSQLQFLWGQSVAGGVTSFVLYEGTIYAQGQGTGSPQEPNLAAIDAATGAALWTVTTGNFGDGLTSSYTIAANGSLVFAGCGFSSSGGSGGDNYGGICAYNGQSGKLHWHYANPCNCLPESEVIAPLTYADGVVYFGYGYGGSGGSEYLVAADAKSGAVLWTYVTGTSNTMGSAAPVVGNGMVYFTCGGNDFSGVCAVSTSTHDIAWSANFGTSSMGLTLAGDVLYVNGGGAGEFAALNATSGDSLWTVEGNSAEYPVSVAASVIYATGSDGYVHALRAHDGSEKWSLFLASQSSVSLANGVLYDDQQGSNNPPTEAYSMKNGAPLWSVPGGASTVHPPAIIANGTLYIGNGACGVVCAYVLPTESTVAARR